MSNLDQIRQAVIDAAMVVVKHWDDNKEPTMEHEAEFANAVRALREAEKPDVWGLLRSIRNMIVEISAGHLAKDTIDSALAWRERNPDD